MPSTWFIQNRHGIRDAARWGHPPHQFTIWRLEGVSRAEMARRLKRSLSTVNREPARKRLPSKGNQPSFAEGSYLAWRERLAPVE